MPQFEGTANTVQGALDKAIDNAGTDFLAGEGIFFFVVTKISGNRVSGVAGFTTDITVMIDVRLNGTS
jgi:hypothetical protein